jgi:hypothetical protein
MRVMPLSPAKLHDYSFITSLNVMSGIQAHKAPVPEPIEDPLPGEHPVPQEDPVPSPHPEIEDPRP